MACDGFGLYPLVVLMLGSGVALSGNGAGVGTSGITGNGVAAHARDPAEKFRLLHRDRAAEKDSRGLLVAAGVESGVAYERPGDAVRLNVTYRTGVLVPVEGLRALQKRKASRPLAVPADAGNASEAGAAVEPEAPVDELAALAAQAAAAKRRRIRNAAAIALPLAPADAPDKVAGVGTRLRVQQVQKALELFVSEQPDGWLPEGAVPTFDQVWMFVRDEL